MYTIIHDNGVFGQKGYTEYTAQEIEKMGGIDELKSQYEKAGITISEILY